VGESSLPFRCPRKTRGKVTRKLWFDIKNQQ